MEHIVGYSLRTSKILRRQETATFHRASETDRRRAVDADTFTRAAEQASRSSGHRVTYARHHRHNEALVAARFALANGLRIVLLPDERAPVFGYQTWFAVGSKHEDPSRTGLAHLFEHLMFKGTHNHPAGEFDREMERRGTQTNAATWVDWTYYTETLAARGDNLATVIGFESDRMTELVLDQTTFLSELEVVKNERRMSVEDSPAGVLSEALYAAAYTAHPYRWPTIGAMSHLEAATLDDLRRFYRAFYAPNNATVVVAGTIDVTETLILLARAYGPLSAQALPPPPSLREPPQTAPRMVKVERLVTSPQVLVGYHAPAQGDPDYAVAEMLGEVLTTGDNGRLYRRLVTEAQIASDVGGSLMPFAEPGLFEIMVTLRPDVDPRAAVQLVQDELDALAKSVSLSELHKAKNGLELGWLESLSTADGCAESLGHFETIHGDFSEAFVGPRAWEPVTPADLVRVSGYLFQPTNRTVAVVHSPANEAR